MTIRDIDYERAAALLDVVQKCATVGPMFASLAGWAGEELKDMNTVAAENAKELAAQREANRVLAEQARAAEAAATRDADGNPNPPPRRLNPSVFPANSGVQETPNTDVVERKV